MNKLIVGPILTNCYLIADEQKKKAIAIDPGKGAAEKVVNKLDEMRVELIFIVNTHGHWDHVADNTPLQKATGARILIHKEDEQRMLNPKPLMKLPFAIEPSKADAYLEDGKKIELGATALECVHTPGHTPGSTCLYARSSQTIFTGDTLFEGAHGRTDFPGGNAKQIRESLRKLSQLPAQTRVLPGHGIETTIAQEKKWIDAMT